MEKQETPRYEVRPVTESDIVKQEDFGTFRIIKTPWNIIYTNYVGYTVMTAPYTTTPQGRSGKLSLYEWLEYVLNSKEEFLSSEKETLNELGITYGEWLEHMKEMTEAVMTKPCVVFTDLDYAEKLEHQIRMHELDLNDRIKDIPQIILLLEQGFSELIFLLSFRKNKTDHN